MKSLLSAAAFTAPLRMKPGHAERNKDGTWQVPPDYLKRARVFERKNSAGKPVQIDLKSRLPLNKSTNVIGRTWLDEELAFLQKAQQSRILLVCVLRGQSGLKGLLLLLLLSTISYYIKRYVR